MEKIEKLQFNFGKNKQRPIQNTQLNIKHQNTYNDTPVLNSSLNWMVGHKNERR